MEPPFSISTVDNPFGPSSLSVQAYYKSLGLLGHPGLDFDVPYGRPIKSAANCICSSVLSKDNTNLSAFRAVNTIVEDETGCYEVQYGHCSQIFAEPGKSYEAGTVLAEVGNTGSVFYNGVEVTEAEKQAGSENGSHLHFQVRVLKKVPANDSQYAHYLNDGSGRLTLNGFAYAVPSWDNGYNGCVDPMRFFASTSHQEPQNKVNSGKTQASTQLSPSDQIAVFAAKLEAEGQYWKAKILFALVSFLKSIGS